MKSLILNFVYALTLVVLVPWLVWRAVRYGKNRRGWGQKLFGLVPVRESAQHDQRCVWFHAVSVGEVNLLSTFLTRLERELPGWEFAISTSTETGYDLARKKYSQHRVFFCPIDFTWAINEVLDRINPSMVILAELEVWPNLVRAVARREIPLTIVNGRLSEKSFRGYRRLGFLMRRLLPKFDWISVQTPTYAQRFLALGADESTVSVTGNVKFDGAQMDRANPRTQALTQLAGYTPCQRVLVAGSTQPEEDRMAVEAWSRLVEKTPELRLVLVPRHPQNVGLAVSRLSDLGVEYTLRSQLEAGSSAAGVLIVDTVGELNAWWGRADIAYVGGSMGSRGGQNMIEPAAYGAPVCYGPNTRNFKDVTELLREADASRVVHNAGELQQFIQRVLDEPVWASGLGTRAQEVVIDQQGAADQAVQRLLGLLNVEPKANQAAA